nr:hypothetical protein [Tanacetum cinerariifolium]
DSYLDILSFIKDYLLSAHCAGMPDNKCIPRRIWDVAGLNIIHGQKIWGYYRLASRAKVYREPAAMSSSDSTVTYTSVSSEDVPFWGIRFFGMEQPDSPEAALQSPIQTPPVPQDEDEQDEHILPAEEHPLPPVVSPTAESPEYVAESDPKEDPEEYDDDETEDGPVDYSMDRGYDGDDDDGDSLGDDIDDEDEDKEDDEEEEEHLALAATISFPPEAEVERLLAMPTPSPSPLSSLSPLSAGERLARCTVPTAYTQVQALINAVTAAIPSPPLPPPLYIPLPVDHRDDILKIEMPPRKRLCLSTLGSRYEIEESYTAKPTGDGEIDYGFVSTLDVEARRRGVGEVGYGIRDTWVDPAETVPEIAPMTVGKINTRVTELAELHEHDTHDLYALLEDAQDSRTRISQRVAMDSQRVDLLIEDMIAHQKTIQIMKEKAYAAREAWAHSIGLSHKVYSKLQTHQEQVYAYEFQLQMQQTKIAELRETDRRRQAQMVETLRVMRDTRREMGDMQAELLALREQPRRARQPRGDARVPDHQDAPRDTDSHI